MLNSRNVPGKMPTSAQVSLGVARKVKANGARVQIKKYVPEQLSFWPDDRRALANELVRCALFKCRDARKKREYYDNVSLFMLGEGAVTYKGEELREKDEAIFVTLAHHAREMPSGKMTVRISNSDICKQNKWQQDQRYYNEIFKSIQRMKGGVIHVFSRRLAKALKCQRAVDTNASDEELARLYDELVACDAAQSAELEIRSAAEYPLENPAGGEIGGMMLTLISGDPTYTGAKFMGDNIPQGNLIWEIALDRNMVLLFAKPYLTLVDLSIWQSLDATGKRLLSYFKSHKKPLPVKCRSLEKMLGLSFREARQLKAYIAERLELIKHQGGIEGYSFEKSADGKDWRVTVERKACNHSK